MADEVLGSGVNRAYIYDRRGEQQFLELDASQITWPRALCDIGRATVEVAAADCPPEVARLHPWAYTVVIYRNDVRVWEGPLRQTKPSATGLTLTASDVIGITERRPVRTARKLASTPVVTEMDWTVDQAFAVDDPNVLSHVQIIGGTGANTSRDVQANQTYHASDLGDLVGAGGRWTALGRSILLWADTTVIGRTPTLSPETHMSVSVETPLDGDSLATQVIARDDDGRIGAAGGTDSFYGLVALLDPAAGKHPVAALNTRAAAVLRHSYPVPQEVILPSNAALLCDAPFPLDSLVPGVLVPVEASLVTGATISATLALSGVTVTQDADEAESVAITLVPAGDIGA